MDASHNCRKKEKEVDTMQGFTSKRKAAAVYAPSRPVFTRRVSYAQRSDQPSSVYTRSNPLPGLRTR